MPVLFIRPRFVKRLLCLAGVLVLVICCVGRVWAAADPVPTPPGPAWASPKAMTTRRVSALGTVPNQPNFLSNLDCQPTTYRAVGSSTMQTGCFTPTAFGMFDSGNDTVIFNGTDEALPLRSYSPHQVLAPWPNALNLVTLDASDYGGSYIGLYKNPLALMRDQRDLSGQLVGKHLTGPPEILLKDANGQLLRINSQTMAFSSGGSWLVAETMVGSFVRVNLATLDMTAFAPSFGMIGSPALFKSQVTVSDDGRFVAIENANTNSFKVYDLSTCGDPTGNLRPQNCRSYEYWPFVNKQISGVKYIRHVRFINGSLLGFEVSSSDTADSGVYELAPSGSIDALIDYLGLGDSYTSGEGAFDYISGTDTDTSTCHLSSKSYPLLLTRDLFSASSGHSVACSGAVIDDIGSLSDKYHGQVKGSLSYGQFSAESRENILADFSPGYIPQHRFVQRYQPRVVTVSIGGNDIGFGSLLEKCVMPHISRHLSDSTCYNTYESRAEVVQLVDRTIPRWTALYKQLQGEDPDGRLYAIGYPSIASDTGSCGLNVNLGKGELEFAEELIAYLNEAIQQATSAADVPYVDISHALVGHRLCEATGAGIAVNGLTAGRDSGIFGINVLGRESYHPNTLGHELIEQAILKQTNNLTKRPVASTNDSNHNLLDVPKTGAVIHHLIPDNSIIKPLVQAGVTTSLWVDGARDGLPPHSQYTIHSDGPAGPVLAGGTSAATGDITADITMPPGTAGGGSSVDITGTNQAGEPVDITTPIYVTVSDNDADSDGTPDDSDSCPYAINSGQDTDRDGIDDICDGSISPSPTTSAGTSKQSNGNMTSGKSQANTIQSAPQMTVASVRDILSISKISKNKPLGVREDTQNIDVLSVKISRSRALPRFAVRHGAYTSVKSSGLQRVSHLVLAITLFTFSLALTTKVIQKRNASKGS